MVKGTTRPLSPARGAAGLVRGPDDPGKRRSSSGQASETSVSGSTRAGQDRVAVFGAQGRPRRPEVMGRRDAGQLVHWRETWNARHAPRRSWSADLADEVTEADVVMHEQDPCLTLTDHAECMRNAPGHRDPVPGSDDQLVIAAAHDHLPIDNEPGVVEDVVDVKRGSRADWQGHLEHDRAHFGCAAVLNDQGIEEPPRLCLFAFGGVNNCCRHFGHLLPTCVGSQVSLRSGSYGNLTTVSSDSFAEDHHIGQRSPYIGALFGVVWQWVRDQMYAGVVAAGYDDLSAAHVGLWRYPGLDGLRPTQLAEHRGITKQSVNDLLGYLERQGYLERVPDAVDGRARVIRLTSKGRGLQDTIYAEAGAAQLRIADILGPRRFAQLHSSLELLTELLS